jgi:mono/diheme cytochrome c family protein
MMDALFWQRLHGGMTHLPIVLLPLSVVFDLIALRLREDSPRRTLHLAGLALAGIGTSAGFGAVLAGLALTHGTLRGSGEEKLHHLFVWPAFALSFALVAGRLLGFQRISRGWLRVYLAGMSLASALMLGAGYWGGEMLLHAVPQTLAPISVSSPNDPSAVRGHDLFLMNCAHCHGDDARGSEEAPDLTGFNRSDARIASVVKNGIKGEMPRFGQKLTDEDVQMLIRFIHSLKKRVA